MLMAILLQYKYVRSTHWTHHKFVNYISMKINFKIVSVQQDAQNLIGPSLTPFSALRGKVRIRKGRGFPRITPQTIRSTQGSRLPCCQPITGFGSVFLFASFNCTALGSLLRETSCDLRDPRGMSALWDRGPRASLVAGKVAVSS